MLLAATGMRAVEALNIRIKDIDFDNKPATIYVRGENTKTKTDRIIFLTEEVTNQLNAWLKYKHRTRRVCYQDKDDDRETRKQLRNIEHHILKKLIWYLQYIKVIKHPIQIHCMQNYQVHLAKH